jgi:Flp pilus assembly protein TadG
MYAFCLESHFARHLGVIMVMRNRENESGQALVLVALSMAVLMGFMALAIDVGLLFRSRRNLQIAADSAAAAAAVNYLYTNDANAAAAAAALAATANGVTISAVNDVHFPPLNGPFKAGTTADGSYFEVIAQQQVGTNFMGVITHTSTTKVAARAVAGTPAASKNCIYITGTGSDVLDMQGGSSSINAPGCGIYVNSSATNPAAVQSKGNATVTAASFNVVGGYSGNGQGIQGTTPTTGSAPMSNPFGNLAGPTPTLPAGNPACTNTVAVAAVTTASLKPASQGIVCFSAANATLSAGITLPGGVIYVFEHDLTIGGTMTLGAPTPIGSTTTLGVTLDIYGGQFNQGNSLLSIYAPTSGTYNGIAIMQPPTNHTDLNVQSGSGSQHLDGWLYAPGAAVNLQDHGGGVTATGIVAASLQVKASTLTIPSTYNSAHPGTTPFRSVTLVE